MNRTKGPHRGDWKKIVPSLPQRRCRIKPPNPPFERTRISVVAMRLMPPSFRAPLNATLDARERQLLPTRTSASPRQRRLNDRYVARCRVTATGRKRTHANDGYRPVAVRRALE